MSKRNGVRAPKGAPVSREVKQDKEQRFMLPVAWIQNFTSRRANSEGSSEGAPVLDPRDMLAAIVLLGIMRAAELHGLSAAPTSTLADQRPGTKGRTLVTTLSQLANEHPRLCACFGPHCCSCATWS